MQRLQPNASLTERIASVLADAGTNPTSGFAQGFTYRQLAEIAYRTAEPTASQLSAVRRSGARLLERGQVRKSRRGTEGVEIRRPMTSADREARTEAMRPLLERLEARRRATPYAVDTGYDGVVTVLVEPVLRITAHGVELRESRESESR